MRHVWTAKGFVGGPNWSHLRCPTQDQQSAEPGEWQHGWQYHASSSSEHHVWKTVVHAQSSAADQAHLRSDPGPCAGQVLIGCPASPEFEVKPHLFRTIVRERMRLPLINEARCECGGSIDCRGRHRRACSRSGRLRSRAVSTEKSLARMCREAGATVRCNPKFRDLIVNVLATDERAIEVLFSGQQMNHGAQLAVDITTRSAVTVCGRPCPNAA